MSKSSVNQLVNELRRVINYAMMEQKLNLAEGIGAIEILKLELFLQFQTVIVTDSGEDDDQCDPT